MAIPTITDRNVQYPNRVQLTEVTPDVYDMTPVTGTVAQAGTNVNKALLDQFAVETQTDASSAKTTPVDADRMPLVDSAASNVLKKVTWANIKATLKAYFDGLYAAAPTWHNIGDGGEPAFQNSWVNFGSTFQVASFCKTADGRVTVRGTVKSGTSGQVVFALPSGYRPAADQVFSLDGNGSHARALVASGGNVTITGSTTAICLDGISFYV